MEWVWAERIPVGMATILLGSEGWGKTAAGLAIAAAITRGTLVGDLYGRPAHVAVLAPEDDARAVIRPRLEAAGADLARVREIVTRQGEHDAGIALPGDTDPFVEMLVADDIEFIFVDPFASLLDPSLDSWKDTDIRHALQPLVGQLAAHRITLLGVLHTNKGKSTDPRERGMGSVGWRQIARSQIMLGPDPEDSARMAGDSRCIAHTKCNVGRLASAVRVTHDEAPVLIGDKAHGILRATLGEECDVSASAMLAAEQEVAPAKPAARLAEQRWLEAQLRDGPCNTAGLQENAEEAGFAWRTIKRAKADLQDAIRTTKDGRGGWSWALQQQPF